MFEYLPYIIALVVAVVVGKFFLGGSKEKTITQDPSPTPSPSVSTKTSNSDLVDVCSFNDIPDEGLKEVEIGDEGKVLLVKQKGELYAVSSKCSHYQAPLAKGALGDCRIRCPWHGACFNLKTGDIEDYPCVDGIQTFETSVNKGRVFVKADKNKLSNFRRTQTRKPSDNDQRTVVILGGGPCGLTAAETLRNEGFGGRIVMVGKEKHLPYDRPKLSKSMTLTADKILLRTADFMKDYNIETILGVKADMLNTSEKSVQLSNGDKLSYDLLLIATGGNARTLPSPGFNLENIFQLRVPEEAVAISSLVAGKKVVIVGTSFIGMEAASCVVSKASSVIAIGMEEVPFERVLGSKIGAAFQKFHENNKVEFRLKRVVKEFQGVDGKLTKVVLDNGEELDADICIVGAGIVPATEFITPESGITLHRDLSVIVDEYLQAADSIYAAGDLARYPCHFLNGELIRVEHYGMSQYQGKLAALNMLGKKVPVRSIPYFWTTQFNKRLNYAGHALSYDDVIIDGSLDDLKFVAYYIKGSEVLAVASMGRDPIVSKAAELMDQGKMISAEQVKSGTFIQ